MGGDRIHCEYDISAPTCDLTTIKLHWNSVLSTPGAKYATFDTSKIYLGTPMARPEYMRLPLRIIPPEIVQKYNLEAIAHDGWVYIKIVKGMYGLPQAGKLANDLLRSRLAGVGCHPCQYTAGLWTHV